MIQVLRGFRFSAIDCLGLGLKQGSCYAAVWQRLAFLRNFVTLPRPFSVLGSTEHLHWLEPVQRINLGRKRGQGLKGLAKLAMLQIIISATLRSHVRPR
jgi:hypothetical protein